MDYLNNKSKQLIIPPFNNFLIEIGTKNHSHVQSTLYDHLVGTWKILKGWKCSDDVCHAGLFHSIYGTQVFKPSLIPSNQREMVQSLIGKPSENLVYLFHITPFDRCEYFVKMSEPTRSDLIIIEYANAMEQYGESVDIKQYFKKYQPYLPKK